MAELKKISIERCCKQTQFHDGFQGCVWLDFSIQTFASVFFSKNLGLSLLLLLLLLHEKQHLGNVTITQSHVKNSKPM
jgi:hypothetical protein